MAENKTRPTDASVAAYIDSRASAAQREDCARLMALLGRVTKQEPCMWGPSIVGFGSYRYRYDSGREGEACRVCGDSISMLRQGNRATFFCPTCQKR